MIKVEKFNVRILGLGERYGRNDCLVNKDEPMVEFYDGRYTNGSFGERGQFVSRYFVSTILNGNYSNGLCLHGGIDGWSVSAEGMKEVIKYAKESQNV